jgi:hypothetical protein
MASTYSALKIELIGTGEQSGTWGTTTNNNLGNDALGEAITGSADVAFSSADVTVTLTDTNASQAARNLRLNLTGTSGGARQLILGSGCQIEKLYLINNGLADAVTVKNTSGSGIAVPAGKTMFVYNNGTNVVDAVTHASSLTLGSALPIASGGTGSTSTTFVNAATNVTGTLPIANGGTGTTSTTFTNLTTNVTGTLPIANGGTGTTSTTFTNLTTNVTGTLPIANGGTGSTSTTFVNAATNITGTLPVANGGTGASTLTSANVILGAGTSAVTFVAPGSNGNVLTSNGSTWTSAAASGGQFRTQLFTSPGTWTNPGSVTQVRVTVVGGGGGGSNNPTGGATFGGDGSFVCATAPVSGPITVTVGAGGTSSPPLGSALGGTGGTSSFGPLVTATGGTGAASGGGPGGTPGSGSTTGTALRIFGSAFSASSLYTNTVLRTGGSGLPGLVWSAPSSSGAGNRGSGGPSGFGGVGGIVAVEFVG